MQDKLKQIDRHLMELLSERIVALSEAQSARLEATSLPPETSQINAVEEAILAQQLAQKGVPSFVWNSLITGCAAAAAMAAAPTAPSKRVAIVGGSGRMGRFFAQQLAQAGHWVSCLGRDWQPLDLETADLVLVCVPIQQTPNVIQQITASLPTSVALADLTGVKTPIVQTMLAAHAGPVLGLHPLFGPGIQSFLSQNVVVCPGRQLDAFQWFLDWMRHSGSNLIFCSPEEHDRMMVTVQAIRHFLTFGLGVFLAEADIDLDRSLEFSSPPYRLQLNLVSRLFAQDAGLHVEMMLGLEERRQAICQLAATFDRLAQLVAQEDQAALKQTFESTGGVFQAQMSRALEESNHVIESLSVLLAADAAQSGKPALPQLPIADRSQVAVSSQ